MSGCLIRSCHAAVTGGAICAFAGSRWVIDTSTIANCTAEEDGGAIAAFSQLEIGSDLVVRRSEVSDCRAARGGAVFLGDATTNTITNLTEVSGCRRRVPAR